MTSRTRSKKSRTRSRSRPKQDHWEFLIRVVDGPTMTYIASLKGLYPRVSDREEAWLPSIYTSYLSSDINSNWIGKNWHHDRGYFGNYILVFHPDLLRDLPFIVCNADMKGKCKNPNLTEEERDKITLLSSPKKKKASVDMRIVSDWINHSLDPENRDPSTLKVTTKRRFGKQWKHLNRFLDKLFGSKKTEEKMSYPFSHEVLFDYIPLKYLVHIFTYNSNSVYALHSYFPKIPVTVLDIPDPTDNDRYRDIIIPQLKKIYKNLKPLKKARKTSRSRS